MTIKYNKSELALMDEFARTALQSILTHKETYVNNTAAAVAHRSYEYAEAMVKARRSIVDD